MNRSARVAVAGIAVCVCFASASGQETAVPASPSVSDAPAPPPAVAPEPVPAQNLSAAPAVAPAPDMAGLTTYTVQKGDSLWKIGRKFGVSVDGLLLANGLKSDHVLQIGDALKIPPKQAKTAPGEPPPAGTPAPALQPGQYMVRQGDTLWDIARAHGVSVQEILKSNNMKSNRLQIGQILTVPPAPPGAMPQGAAVPAAVAPAPTTPPAPSEPAIRPMESAPAPTPAEPAPVPAPVPGSSSYRGAPGTSVSAAFVRETQELAARRIRYAQRWRPPGQREPWLMDCSNTSRYLYRRVAGIDIGRTASDQYYLLHRRGLAWRVPASLEGAALVDHLARNLRSGDLLFWENTYKPKRNPPVTHVMVYLGRTREGRLMMAGSQSHGAGRDPAVSGGPDLYFFDPLAPAGGYSNWLGFVRVKGRFAAFGRPLAAPGASGALTAAKPAARPSI